MLQAAQSWFKGLKPLTKFGVVTTLLGIFIAVAALGVQIYDVFGIPKPDCRAGAYDACRDAIRDSEREKIGNNNIDPAVLDHILVEKFGYTENQLRELALNFQKEAKTEYDRGLAAAALSQYSEAAIHFDNAIRQDPSNPNYYMDKAIAQLYLQDYASALETTNKAVDLFNGTSSIALMLQGDILRSLGRINESISSYAEGIRINPNNAELWRAKGLTLKAQGRTEEAITALEKAVALNPNSIDAKDSLAITYIQVKRYEEAVVLYNEILTQVPAWEKAYDNRGYARFHLERYEEALEDWELALSLEGDNHTACRLANVAIGLGHVGRGMDAHYYLTKAYQVNPNFDVHCFNKRIEYVTWLANIDQEQK